MCKNISSNCIFTVTKNSNKQLKAWFGEQSDQQTMFQCFDLGVVFKSKPRGRTHGVGGWGMGGGGVSVWL